MLPPMVVFTNVIFLIVCGSSWAVLVPGWQDLIVLDEVLRNIQATLEIRLDAPQLLTGMKPSSGLHNESRYEDMKFAAEESLEGIWYSTQHGRKEDGNARELKEREIIEPINAEKHIGKEREELNGKHSKKFIGENRKKPSISFAPMHDAERKPKEDNDELPNNSQKRLKRVTPTPPPSFCRPVMLPEHINKWEQLKFLVYTRPSGCHHHRCCQRQPDPCPHKPEILVARLALLDEKLRMMDRLEARLKVHISLLNSIHASSKFPGEAGEPGAPGRKGHQGFKGLPGHAGPPGACRIIRGVEPPAGPPGPNGNKGNTGQPGSKVCGCDGYKGETGAPGRNVRGPPGPIGAKGQKGERGQDLPILQR